MNAKAVAYSHASTAKSILTAQPSASNRENGDDCDVWQTGVYVICGCAGYIIYLAWFFILFVTPGFSLSATMSQLDSYLFHATFFSILALALVVIWAFSNSLYSKQGANIIFVAAILFSPAATAIALFSDSFILLLIGWVLSGIGCSCLMIQTATFLGTFSHRKIIVCTASSFALAVCLFLLVYYLQPIPRLIVVSLMPILTAGLFYFLHFRYLTGRLPEIDAKESSKRNKMSWKSLGASFGHSMCIGFAIYCCSAPIAEPSDLFVLASAGAALLASAAMILDGYFGIEKLNSEGMQLKVFLPCAAIGLLPMPFLGATGRLICCIVLFLVFIPQVITNVNAVAESIYLYRLSPVRAYPPAREANILGFLAGYTVGFIAFGYSPDFSSQSSIGVLLILIFILIVLAAFLFQDRYPSALPDSMGEANQEATKKQRWKMKCSAFAERINLSPRQTEVLCLLAKGYNTKYIEEHLFISNHTAKSHIYSIYQKAGVHSRQEIIELIEQMDIDGAPM